jgi:hypothetical protein
MEDRKIKDQRNNGGSVARHYPAEPIGLLSQASRAAPPGLPVVELPDSYDSYDNQPNRRSLSEDYLDATLPDHVIEAIRQRKTARPPV